VIGLQNERRLERPLPEGELCSTDEGALGLFPAGLAHPALRPGVLRASSIGLPRWVLSLAVALLLLATLVPPQATAASHQFPSGLAEQWCGAKGAADFKPGWFPQARPQVKVVYAYATDQAGQFQVFSDLIQRHIREALELVSDESEGRRSIAFDLGTECGPRYVDIASVPLAHDSATYRAMPPTIDGRSAAIQTEVRKALGLDPKGGNDRLGLGGKRNFAVYVNIGNVPNSFARGDMPGCPLGGSHPSCQPDDQAGPETRPTTVVTGRGSGRTWAS
jgi:hypothetical protein